MTLNYRVTDPQLTALPSYRGMVALTLKLD
jgi:hypothetical protein